MASRGWTAVLLLFAVLAMHGLQCGSGADGDAHTGAAPLVAVTASPAGDPHLAHAASTPSTPLLDGHDGATAPVPDGEHSNAPVQGAGHLWAVCLAVLAAGLALLLALVPPRLLAPAPATLVSSLTRALGASPLGRPPDLHALCLLRI